MYRCRHIAGQGEQKDEAREKAREEARKKLEEQMAKSKDQQPKPLPEFGSTEDWPLRQALNHLQGKTVVSYCTGGIRCEKAAIFLREAGVDRVLQLDGGILGYFELINDSAVQYAERLLAGDRAWR